MCSGLAHRKSIFVLEIDEVYNNFIIFVLTIKHLRDLTMSTLTDKAWESLQNGETVFEIGVCTFNGCTVKVTQLKEPYSYVTRTGKPAIKSARYWGSVTFPGGIRTEFKNKRGGEVARATGFAVKDEKKLWEKDRDNYVLPYERNM